MILLCFRCNWKTVFCKDSKGNRGFGAFFCLVFFLDDIILFILGFYGNLGSEWYLKIREFGKDVLIMSIL